MPKFRVYEAQEEICCRKWLHYIDAANEQEAVEKIATEDWFSDPVDSGELGEPDYVNSGFAARLDSPDEDSRRDSAWEDAVSDLVTRKTNESAVNYMQNALIEILSIAQKGIDDRTLRRNS